MDKLAIQQLEEWINEFKEVTSYHQGDYKEGMNMVLEGVSGQLNALRSVEKKQMIDFADNYGFDVCAYDYDKADKYFEKTFKN